jgi:hypothetical protein
MNFGFFGFPNKIDSNIISVRELDTSGTYNIPRSASSVLVYAVAGGAGGGGGGRRNLATNYGGGGGSGGAQYYGFLPEVIVGRGGTIEVTLGLGGGGGAAATIDTANGSNGTAGGVTNMKYYGYGEAPYVFLNLLGGLGGGGGSNLSVTGGTARTSLVNGYSVTNFAGGGQNSTTGADVTVLTTQYNGGAQGGGISSANAAGTAGSILKATISATNTSAYGNPKYAEGAAYCAGSSANSSAAGQSIQEHIFGIFSSGFGGAGGGCGTTVLAGAGGNGYRGGGGGGGGAAVNGIAAGAGGRGGNGYAVFVALR